jgi:Transposase DDE domain
MQRRLDRKPDRMKVRRRTVEHIFGTLKHWMGSTHFLMKTLAKVGTEMNLHVLAYNPLVLLLGVFFWSGDILGAALSHAGTGIILGVRTIGGGTQWETFLSARLRSSSPT